MEYYLAIALFAVSSSITPGPNNIMIMASGMNYGVLRSIPHLLGISIGFPVMLAMIGLILGTLFERYPLFHVLIKVAGTAYLLYLAWLIARARPGSMEADSGNPIGFWRAFWFQWLNPKAWVMATGAIAAFTSQGSGIYLQVTAIVVVFLLLVLPCTTIWMYFGIGLRRVLNNPRWQRLFNITMALLLVFSIYPAIRELMVDYLLW